MEGGVVGAAGGAAPLTLDRMTLTMRKAQLTAVVTCANGGKRQNVFHQQTQC